MLAEERQAVRAATPARGVHDRFVGERERREITGVPRQTWWRMERAGQAPGRLQVTPGRVGWRLSELLQRMDERPRARLKEAEPCPPIPAE